MAAQTAVQTATPAKPRENIARGLLFALGAVPVGILIYLFLAQAGFIASISSYVMVYLGVQFYIKGAKSLPIKGLYWFLALMVLGVFLSIVAAIAADALKFYDHYAVLMTISKLTFVKRALTRPAIWRSYWENIVLSIGFAALGMFRTLTRLFYLRKSRKAK